MTTGDPEYIQDEFDSMLNVLSDYTPRNKKYSEAKNKLLGERKNY